MCVNGYWKICVIGGVKKERWQQDSFTQAFCIFGLRAATQEQTSILLHSKFSIWYNDFLICFFLLTLVCHACLAWPPHPIPPHATPIPHPTPPPRNAVQTLSDCGALLTQCTNFLIWLLPLLITCGFASERSVRMKCCNWTGCLFVRFTCNLNVPASHSAQKSGMELNRMFSNSAELQGGK